MNGSRPSLAIGAVERVEDLACGDPDALAVVIDVLRATTTIVAALAAGARSVIPVESVDEGFARRAGGVPGEVVLGGERRGRPVSGFDLGNSPADYGPGAVRGRDVVLTTTNGTRALAAVAHLRCVLVGCLWNRRAIAEAVAADAGPLLFVCSGTDGRPSTEDGLAAGAIIHEILRERSARLDRVATRLVEAWRSVAHRRGALLEALRGSHGGANLRAIGLDSDIEDAAHLDVSRIVPMYRNGAIRCAEIWPLVGRR